MQSFPCNAEWHWGGKESLFQPPYVWTFPASLTCMVYVCDGGASSKSCVSFLHSSQKSIVLLITSPWLPPPFTRPRWRRTCWVSKSKVCQKQDGGAGPGCATQDNCRDLLPLIQVKWAVPQCVKCPCWHCYYYSGAPAMLTLFRTRYLSRGVHISRGHVHTMPDSHNDWDL